MADDTTPAGVSMENIRLLIELDDRIADGEAAVKDLKKQREQVEASLVKQFQNEGAQGVKLDGRTIYLQETTRRSLLAEHRAAGVDYFTREGLDEFVTVQPQRFASWANHYIDEHGALPPELDGKVSTYEKVSIRNRKA